jgi:ABC-type uncharacterized transport system permease subunit
MPVPAEAFLSPKSAQKSVSTRFRQRKECLYRSADAVFLGFPHYKNILRAFLSSILPIAILSRLPLSNTVTFQNT